jgi:hypothetical protein
MYLEGIEIVLTCGTDCGNKITVEWPVDEYASLDQRLHRYRRRTEGLSWTSSMRPRWHARWRGELLAAWLEGHEGQDLLS